MLYHGRIFFPFRNSLRNITHHKRAASSVKYFHIFTKTFSLILLPRKCSCLSIFALCIINIPFTSSLLACLQDFANNSAFYSRNCAAYGMDSLVRCLQMLSRNCSGGGARQQQQQHRGVSRDKNNTNGGSSYSSELLLEALKLLNCFLSK